MILREAVGGSGPFDDGRKNHHASFRLDRIFPPPASSARQHQVERAGTGVGGGLPVLGDSWRDTLLLQALRETGEEMKRRRQTYREVRARHAAEEEEEAAAAASFVCGDSLGSHGNSSTTHGISSSVAMVMSQAGGEGRWKPPLSRSTCLSIFRCCTYVSGKSLVDGVVCWYCVLVHTWIIV